MTKVRIIDQAFALLGRAEYVPGDDSESGNRAERLLPNVLERTLSKGFWRSAFKSVQLNGVLHKDGEYVFALPANYLVLIHVDANTWAMEGGKLYCSLPTVQIQYVESQRESFDATLIRYAALELASDLALSFTGSLASRQVFKEEQMTFEAELIRMKFNEANSSARNSPLLAAK